MKSIILILLVIVLSTTGYFQAQNNINGNKSFIKLSTFLNANASDPETGYGNNTCYGNILVYCYNGGCRSKACSISAGITILGCGVTAGGSVDVSDPKLEFACCSMRCKSYTHNAYRETNTPQLN